MHYKNLQQFIDDLEKSGELLRIKEFVSPDLEITEIADRYIKQNGPALLFENTGTDFPLLINSMGSYKRMCMAIGVDDLDDVGRDISELFKTVSYTHLRAHETVLDLVCRLLLEKKQKITKKKKQ